MCCVVHRPPLFEGNPLNKVCEASKKAMLVRLVAGGGRAVLRRLDNGEMTMREYGATENLNDMRTREYQLVP